MSLKPEEVLPVPEETSRLAHIVCPKGALCLWIGDALKEVFQDALFTALFPRRGQPAEAPWRLALVTVLQFVEGLTDRQAADAVRTRIDWKYALRLPLEDQGFDFSVLCEFRTRLIAGGGEHLLFEALLEYAKGQGWLKARGRQRTDSTHVLAAIETLSRLECVAETLRHALNVLAVVVPDWLQAQVPPEWYERYATRWQDYRLPAGRTEREELAAMIGRDGRTLLHLVETAGDDPWLPALPALQVLRRVWIQQFYADQETARWREAKDLPPSSLLICTPYDPDARYSQKRTTIWTGYKVHLTESCDDDTPHVITDVQTTPATLSDFAMTTPIQAALAQREVLPKEHLLDMGYVSAEQLVNSQSQYEVDLVGPVASDPSWQAQSHMGFGTADFSIDWQERHARCPQGGKTRPMAALARSAWSRGDPYQVCFSRLLLLSGSPPLYPCGLAPQNLTDTNRAALYRTPGGTSASAASSIQGAVCEARRGGRNGVPRGTSFRTAPEPLCRGNENTPPACHDRCGAECGASVCLG